MPNIAKQSPYLKNMFMISVPMLIILILFTLTSNCLGKETASTVIIVKNDSHLPIQDLKLDKTTETSLLSLRKYVEPMGVTVKWNPGPIQGDINVTSFSIRIGSKEAFLNLGRRDCKVFF